MAGEASVRRVQLIGRFTYCITLPKEWVRVHGISRGSKVFVEIMPDGSLRVNATPLYSDNYAAKRLEFFSIEDLDSIFFHALSAIIAGYDLVVISFNHMTREHALSLRDRLLKIAPFLQVREEDSLIEFRQDRVRSNPDLEPNTILTIKLYSDLLKAYLSRRDSKEKGFSDRLALAEQAFITAKRAITNYLIKPSSCPLFGDKKLTLIDLQSLSLFINNVRSTSLALCLVLSQLDSTKSRLVDVEKQLERIVEKTVNMFMSCLKLFKEPSVEAYDNIIKMYTEVMLSIGKLPRLESTFVNSLEDFILHLNNMIVDLGVYTSIAGITEMSLNESKSP